MRNLEAFDAATRRRWLIALGVSVGVNAVIFGGAGLVAHQFLKAIQPKPKPITVTRIILPRGTAPGTLPSPLPLPSTNATPNVSAAH